MTRAPARPSPRRRPTAKGLDADLLVVVGDLAYRDEAVPRLRALREAAAVLGYVCAVITIAPAARGEFVGGRAPPYCAFGDGAAAFVMLDTGEELMSGMVGRGEQHEWLIHTLAEPRGTSVFERAGGWFSPATATSTTPASSAASATSPPERASSGGRASR